MFINGADVINNPKITLTTTVSQLTARTMCARNIINPRHQTDNTQEDVGWGQGGGGVSVSGGDGGVGGSGIGGQRWWW